MVAATQVLDSLLEATGSSEEISKSEFVAVMRRCQEAVVACGRVAFALREAIGAPHATCWQPACLGHPFPAVVEFE